MNKPNISLTTIKEQFNVQEIESLTPESVIQFLCPKASLTEGTIFVRLCKAEGLNPFRKEAYLIKFDESQPASIVVGIGQFLKIANRNKFYNGSEAGIIILNKSTSKLEYREGTFYMKEVEDLKGGWARVYHKAREHSETFTVSYEECVKVKKTDKGFVPNAFWSKMPATMLRKNALSRKLREEFPEDLGQLLELSEIDVEHPEMIVADVTPQSNQEMIPDSTTTQTDQELSEQDWTERIPSELVLREEWKAKMSAHFWEQAKALNLNKETLNKHCADLLGIQHEDFAIVAVVTDPVMLRDLNMAWFAAHNQVLFR